MIYILGRQPAISIAELESLYGADDLHVLSQYAVQINNTEEIPFSHIGGAVKVAKLLTSLDTTDIIKIQKFLQEAVPKHLKYLPEGKLKLGISTYGFNFSPARIDALGLTLKKTIRSHERSVRLVPNTETALSSAQVMHNKLTGDVGWEFLLIKDGSNTIIAQTTDVQDIDSYTLRDRGRPKRDARVGMLPPKLAQTIINLSMAMASVRDTKSETQARYNQKNRAEVVSMTDDNSQTILDPFCGTGVILQEAALMGYSVYGTDLEERMVQYSRDNLNWLSDSFKIHFDWNLHQGDATDTTWQKPVDVVACEAYLGRPFTSVPDKEILQKTVSDCDTIIRKFLENIRPQLKSGTRLSLAVPAWFVGGKVHHLKTLDHLSDLGYNRISFVHTKNADLIYHRDEQIVGRELLVISRK